MKAILNNWKIACFTYVLVLLLSTAIFLYVPKGLESQVNQLEQSVQSKQLSVNALKSHPPKNQFTIPKEAGNWLKQLPPDAQVDRTLILLNDLMNQTHINFQSVSLQDTSGKQNPDEMNQILHEILGKQTLGQQNKQDANSGKASSQNQPNQNAKLAQDATQLQSVSLNLSCNGSYYSILDFLYSLVHSERLIRIDSIQLAHDSTGNGSVANQSYVMPKPSMSSGTQTNSANAKQGANVGNSSQTGNQAAVSANTINNNTNVSSPAAILQSLLLNGMANGNQQAVIMPPTVSGGSVPILPVPSKQNDKISVTLTLTIFYMPGASILGNLPDVPVYNAAGRKNPFVP